MVVVDLKQLPNLPGYSVPQYKDSHAKGQGFKIVNGLRCESGDITTDKPKFKAENDRLVLRFNGYFREGVVETNLENYRVRKVLIYYYLEDDTCHIIEPRQDNSGIPQGQLVRRHRFPAPAGGYVKTEDLRVGGTLSVYGKTFMITDCDAFTRDYCMQQGMEQPPTADDDADPFTETREAVRVKRTTQPRTHEKMYREVMLGGGHINTDMQQFLENDKRVLRFFCIMDDVTTPTFERRPFTILFFLSDDTIEIREQYPLNCGRDNFPIFFQRGKIHVGEYHVDGPQTQPRSKSDFVHGHDFAVGMEVKLLGNFNFFIYDADEFTRNYFRQELERPLAEKVEVRLPKRTVPRAETPPHKGYGSWDDSMASVTHLIPKPPRKDYQKLYEHDGKILRYKAKFAQPKAEDTMRVFVVSFHLFDDTLSIHEPPQRNLGIITGKFLEKAVHVNQLTGKLFCKDDLAPGKHIKVYNHEFVILDMDEYTKKRVDDPNIPNCAFDSQAVLEKLRESLRQQFPLVRDIFRRVDTDHDGVLTFAEFKTVLNKFSMMLTDSEIHQVMRHFDYDKNGQVSYNDFCDVLLDEDYTTGMLAPKRGIDASHDGSYAEKAQVKAQERVETNEVRKAVHYVGDLLHKKQGMQTKLCNELQYLTHMRQASCEQIQYAFQMIGQTVDLMQIQRAVLFVDPEADLEKVDYFNVFKAINSSYHDINACR